MAELHDLIPLTAGMIISPLPVVAVVAIVLSPRGRVAAPVYTATFTVASLVAIAIGAIGSASLPASRTNGSPVSFALAIVLFVAFTALAIASWVTRPRAGATPVAPKWLAAIDTITPARAASLGLVMAIVNTKNIPLDLKGGALIGEAHLPIAAALGLCAAIAVAGSLLLIVPTIAAAGGSAATTRRLERLKDDMISHNSEMMAVLFAILAANEAAAIVHQLTS